MSTETESDSDSASTPPSTQEEELIGARQKEEFIQGFRQVFKNPLAKVGAIMLVFFLLMALFGPMVAPYNPDAHQTNPDGSWYKNQGPTLEHPLGTNSEGQDLFSRLLYGARIAFIAGIATALIVGVLGTIAGITAGYYGGQIENFIMRLVDLAYGVPFLPFAIVLIIVLEPSIWNIIIAISALLWRETARVVRSEVITIKDLEMIDAARAAGASDNRILLHHILPKVLPTTVLYSVFAIGWAILTEAGLSFLGLGDPDSISWGRMLQNAYISQALDRELWWWIIPPGLCIAGLVASVYFISQGVEEVVNPKLRDR
ncbi:MAG: ABC transporter permease [Halobacteriales archaeon]